LLSLNKTDKLSNIKLLKWKYLRTLVFLDRHNLKSYLLPIAIFFTISISLAVAYELFRFVNLWAGMPYAGNNALEFCEINRFCEAVVQPANTWSNLGFLFVGLFCLFVGINDAKTRSPEIPNLIVRYPMFSILIGLSCIYLFLGSFLYHASLTHTFQMLDITGMYAVALSFLAYIIFRFTPIRYAKRKAKFKSSHHLIIPAVMLINLLFLGGMWRVNVNILFPIIVLIIITLGVYYNRSRSLLTQLPYQRLAQLSVAIGVIAFVCWILDRQDLWCNPDSLVQGHAVWHLLCAASILLSYLSFRVEKFDIESIYKNKQEVYFYFR